MGVQTVTEKSDGVRDVTQRVFEGLVDAASNVEDSVLNDRAVTVDTVLEKTLDGASKALTEAAMFVYASSVSSTLSHVWGAVTLSSPSRSLNLTLGTSRGFVAGVLRADM